MKVKFTKKDVLELKKEFTKEGTERTEINSKALDSLYKEWSGEHHATNSNKEVHDSSECMDFAEYCLKHAIGGLKDFLLDYHNFYLIIRKTLNDSSPEIVVDAYIKSMIKIRKQIK